MIEHVCPGGDDRLDTDGNGIPDACETAATPGTYSYARLPVALDRAVAADFHPGGSYFVVAESYELVHLFDVATQSLLATADLHVGSGHVYFEHLRFAPSGDYALLTGYDTGTSRGVIFRLDHAAWTAGAPSTAGVFSSYANLPVVASFAAAAWGPLGGTEQLPVVLGRSGTSPYTMRLDVLNPDTGDATLLPSSAAATSAGCQDLAYANNEYGQPGLLVVCGYNGFDAGYYTVVGGVPDLRTPSETGNTNLGNTSHLAAHPSGAYALIVGNSGDAIYRFDEGLLSSYSEAVRFSTRRLWNVGFQQGGQRALVLGRKQTISGVSFGGVFEFRHDFFQCPQPLLTGDVTEVSIPNFGPPPWNASDNTNLMDVAWRPGCDGGGHRAGATRATTRATAWLRCSSSWGARPAGSGAG